MASSSLIIIIVIPIHSSNTNQPRLFPPFIDGVFLYLVFCSLVTAFLFQATVILIFVQVGFCVISFFKSRQSKFTLQHDAHVFSTSFDFSCLSRTFRSPQFFFSTPILPVHPWIFLHHAFGPSLSIPHFLNSPSPLLNGTVNHSTPPRHAASAKTFLPPHF